MDKLEQHIKQNRQQLDAIDRIDRGRLWASIEKDIEKEAAVAGTDWHLQIGRNWQWSIAASIAILLAAWFFWPQPTTNPTNRTIASYFPELKEQEQAYRQLIAQKEAAIDFEQLSRIQYQETFEELQLLEELHTELIRDIPEFGKNERLMQTLLRYYEHKIRILERLTKEIEKQENHEKIPRERRI